MKIPELLERDGTYHRLGTPRPNIDGVFRNPPCVQVHLSLIYHTTHHIGVDPVLLTEAGMLAVGWSRRLNLSLTAVEIPVGHGWVPGSRASNSKADHRLMEHQVQKAIVQ